MVQIGIGRADFVVTKKTCLALKPLLKKKFRFEGIELSFIRWSLNNYELGSLKKG
jgi:hypothetical protein